MGLRGVVRGCVGFFLRFSFFGCLWLFGVSLGCLVFIVGGPCESTDLHFYLTFSSRSRPQPNEYCIEKD